MRHAPCRATLAAMNKVTQKWRSVTHRFPQGWAVRRCRALAAPSRFRLARARQRDRAGARPAAAPATSRPVRPQPARSGSNSWPHRREQPQPDQRLPPTADRRATRKPRCGAAGNERRLMHSITIQQRHEQRLERVPIATPRRQSLSAGHDWVPRSQSRPGRWGLVQVWNGAVLASFDDETSARRAMAWADDDEVVVLYVAS